MRDAHAAWCRQPNTYIYTRAVHAYTMERSEWVRDGERQENNRRRVYVGMCCCMMMQAHRTPFFFHRIFEWKFERPWYYRSTFAVTSFTSSPFVSVVGHLCVAARAFNVVVAWELQTKMISNFIQKITQPFIVTRFTLCVCDVRFARIEESSQLQMDY